MKWRRVNDAYNFVGNRVVSFAYIHRASLITVSLANTRDSER